jgi:hypothetical protein
MHSKVWTWDSIPDEESDDTAFVWWQGLQLSAAGARVQPQAMQDRMQGGRMELMVYVLEGMRKWLEETLAQGACLSTVWWR